MIIKIKLISLSRKYNTMNKGTVKFFNDEKGYGFIKDDETGKEYFVHVSGLADKVEQNDKVSFDLEQGKKGINAINVNVI